MKSWIKPVLLIVILLSLGLFLSVTDWNAVSEAIGKVGYNFLILIVITGLSSQVATWSWQFCLPRSAGRLSAWQWFWLRMIGENIAIVNPASMVGGEASKVYMLGRMGIAQRPALHSVVLSRGILSIAYGILLLISGIWFAWPYLGTLGAADFSWPLVLMILGFSFYMLVNSEQSRAFFRNLFGKLRLLKIYRNARNYVQELWQELRFFYRENRRAMFWSFFFACLHWIVGSLEFYFILLFLGIKTSVFAALLVDLGVVVFKAAGVFIPGQLGVEEYGNKVMLAAIGVSGGSIWVSVSIMRRARQLFWILIGFLVYAWIFRASRRVG